MAHYTYLNSDGQEQLVWLNSRCARMISSMHIATCKRDKARERAIEISGVQPWRPPSGVLAAHATALSAVSVATEAISLPMEALTQEIDLRFVCDIAAEMETVWTALDAVPLEAFKSSGLPQMLPDPIGSCTSAHAAVRAVFADVRERTGPVLENLGFGPTPEPIDVVVSRLREQRTDPLETLLAKLEPHFEASLVRQWSGWSAIEKTLVAEVAGAAQAGLIQADDGGQLDQDRFTTAIESALRLQHEDERQYLFSRWRSLADSVRHVRLRAGLLPSLNGSKTAIHGLGKLTAEVLGQTNESSDDTPSLLELLTVMRELAKLTATENYLLQHGTIPECDPDFAERVKVVAGETLPRVLHGACIEVDRLSLQGPRSTTPTLTRKQRLEWAQTQGRARQPKGEIDLEFAHDHPGSLEGDGNSFEQDNRLPDGRDDNVSSLIKNGNLWDLTFDGKRVTLPHRIGFQHLQHLLAHPHADVHVTDLVTSVPVEAASTQATQSEEALARLKSERGLIAEHLDRSKENNDESQHEKAAEELAQVDGQLAADLGITGPRAMPDAIAKLRSRVGKAIEAAMTAIKEQHPEAHHHLLASVQTPSGLTPSYRPKIPTTWLVNPTA